MPRDTEHPVRRCPPCDRDWPNSKVYNLCPRCQRCTWATTADEYPDSKAASDDAARFKRYREFDAEADAAAQQRADTWAADMNALLELTPSIPDPAPPAEPHPGAKYPSPLHWNLDTQEWDDA